MPLTTEELNQDALEFLLAVMMAESNDTGEFRRKFLAYRGAAYGTEFKDMTNVQIEQANHILHIYAGADGIYHRIKVVE